MNLYCLLSIIEIHTLIHIFFLWPICVPFELFDTVLVCMTLIIQKLFTNAHSAFKTKYMTCKIKYGDI